MHKQKPVIDPTIVINSEKGNCIKNSAIFEMDSNIEDFEADYTTYTLQQIHNDLEILHKPPHPAFSLVFKNFIVYVDIKTSVDEQGLLITSIFTREFDLSQIMATTDFLSDYRYSVKHGAEASVSCATTLVFNGIACPAQTIEFTESYIDSQKEEYNSELHLFMVIKKFLELYNHAK